MLEQNETLWGLIEKVYGAFDMKRFQALKLANPSIKNPNRVEMGQTILVPAIPAAGIEADNGTWRVEVGSADLLDTAMEMFHFFGRQGLAVRLIPHWNSGKGLQFSLFFDERFSSEAKARDRLSELPPAFASGASIHKGWAEGTVFFADPGGRRDRG